MPKKVFFIQTVEHDSMSEIQNKLKTLIDASGLMDAISAGDKVIQKIHFGEKGNAGYVKPEYTGVISREILEKGGVPYLSDTNTLYKGERLFTRDHLNIAREHGFVKETTAAELCIPEDNDPENVLEVNVNGDFVRTAKICKLYVECDTLIAVTHFKGHMMTGFGGAMKNIGMGCAARKGKLEQHSDLAPMVLNNLCTGCGACREVCPVDAIAIQGNKAVLDNELCIGCASCIAACDYGALMPDWESGRDTIQEKMVEYAKSVLMSRTGPSIFINFATKITKECDCLALDDPRIAPDTGIFISDDPVAADKACLDKVIEKSGKDVFKEAHPTRAWIKQLVHAEKVGLGQMEYEIISDLV